MTDSLSNSLERFVRAHGDDLNPVDVYTIGVAAGIIARVHAGAELDEPAELDEAAVLAAGREALRHYHPTLAAEVDAELAADEQLAEDEAADRARETAARRRAARQA